MWITSLLSFIPKLLSGFSGIKNIFGIFKKDSTTGTGSSKGMTVFLLVVIVSLSFVVMYLTYFVIPDLKDEIAFSKDLNEANKLKISELNATVIGLQTKDALHITEKTNMSTLLSQCQESVNNISAEYDEIYQNMLNGMSGNDLNIDDKGDPTYDRVTKEQNTSGIHFINNLLNDIK